MKPTTNFCDDPDAGKLYSKEECQKVGGSIVFPACMGCSSVEFCMLPGKQKGGAYYSNIPSKEPQASDVFEKSLPLIFVDEKYPENKITFQKNSRISNEVTNREGKKMRYSYDPYSGETLSLMRCFALGDGSSTCCDIRLPMKVKNGSLFIGEQEVKGSFRYDGVYRP